MNWSPTVQSALAESELEYNDKHQRYGEMKCFLLSDVLFSMAVYVRFRLQNSEQLLKLVSRKKGYLNAIFSSLL